MTGTGYNLRCCKLAITRVDYHGWPDSYVVTNGIVEAVVVPAVGRVMQFRLVGKQTGVFWENRLLDGLSATPLTEWDNFGGDKAWPAPQEDWARVTGRSWPPPTTFDAVPVKASTRELELTLSSPVDPDYGIQVIRHISMRPGLPVMDITTKYLKVIGAPTKVGVWIVTQLRDPKRVFALLPEGAPGCTRVVGPPPMELHSHGRLISLRRDPNHNTKIATAGNTLAWMDEDYVLRIDGHGSSGKGCGTSVYTNMDPLAYVELETEGPPTWMCCGEHLELTNIYTLAVRSEEEEIAEAEKLFGLATRGKVL